MEQHFVVRSFDRLEYVRGDILKKIVYFGHCPNHHPTLQQMPKRKRSFLGCLPLYLANYLQTRLFGDKNVHPGTSISFQPRWLFRLLLVLTETET